MKILIAGGSGGIGLALVKACLDKFPEASVIATHNKHQPDFFHEQLSWHLLDAINEGQVTSLAEEVGSIDWLINAVGFLHNKSGQPEKTIRKFDPDFFSESLQVNAMPSLLLAKHFQRNLKQSKHPMFATVSAKVGSISDNHLGGWYSYRASKAALNMALKTLSIEWQRTMPKCCVASLHPGTTDTSLSKPFQSNVPDGKLFPPEKTAGLLLDVLQKLSSEQTGRFWSWDGSEIPW
ncbi:SDR family oxidoreductase [Sansalvadorimonas sp. 2012CJ34-2]|uniref:SDR family oxidoreductase n=1 Tax=Parendozoicomonas callyspongiae TaxID=2942213 RepID=A0ABT0PEF9_9GAMM|nr:SDR family oxidoreductase [Sansalvadorimonas sp. 2012CJ34-2]MCL6269693.1 SDR family oxidoreductase [Sansalvadorimonas sp. 2012CJ34-2]